MANSEESNPLLPKQGDDEEQVGMKNEKKSAAPIAKNIGAPLPAAIPVGWTADGLPVANSMMERAHWDSGLFSCLGRNDEFCSSDLEVCLLGSVAPCVLYGSSVERLGSAPGTFANHCLPYTGLYFLGNTFFGWNCLAPWFSYPIRTAIRRKFNLESDGSCITSMHINMKKSCGSYILAQQGSCEVVAGSCGCCGSFVEDEVQREQCEMACDFATHVFCHACALCQEGREIRRRIPHPGFNTQPLLVMIPPGEQTMGRGA